MKPPEPQLTAKDARELERCIRKGGVAVFPADTVYGLACDPDSASAIGRMYSLKGRAPTQPSAVMFFQLEAALAALPELGDLMEQALRALLPGPVTVVVANPAGRFALAAGPRGLGLRVPRLMGSRSALSSLRVPVLQTSANRTGGPDARRVADVPEPIRAGVDLVLDGGELPGTPSTVVDLTGYDSEQRWALLREGAVSGARIEELLG